MKKIISTWALSLGLIFSLVFPAIVHADFNANHLMDDNVFDSQPMDSSQIDNFLNSLPNSCISTNNGFSAPDVVGYSASQSGNSTGGFSYGPDVSAGQIIYHAAHVYNLNPQVILTTLEKEQSLVSGSNGCSTLRYTGAMGYDCPDGGTTYNYSGFELYSLHNSPVTSVSGTCVDSSHTAGFSRQVIVATWQLKFNEQRSEGNTGWNVQMSNFPYSGDTWDNSDDPNTCYSSYMMTGYAATCSGGSVVYWDGVYSIDNTSVTMQTGATASLYSYTPHLAGNQNFVSIFNNWFGATYSADLYTDSDGDGVMNRYDQCLFTPGSPVNFGCPDNTALDTQGFSGDFNGDGLSDLVVLSAMPDGHSFNIWMYPGTASGFGTPVLQDPLTNGNPTLSATNGGFDLQKSKAVAVNVNGDQYMDLVIFHQGPHNEIVRNIFLGSSTGLHLDSSLTVWQYPSSGWQWSYLQIAGAGDFNGDGYGDVAVFSEFPDAQNFNLWVYEGSASNGLQDPVQQLSTFGPSNGWNFTQTKATVADVNGDGKADLVMLSQGPNDEIVRHVFLGSTSGISADSSNWLQWQYPGQGWKWSQIRLAGTGKFEGGLYDGLVVFSLFPDGRTYNVWLWSGGSSGWGASSMQMTLSPSNGGWDFTKSKPVAGTFLNSSYASLAILHQGPHNEIAFNILQGSSSGLSQDPSATTWAFPSQGWLWTNIRTTSSSN